MQHKSNHKYVLFRVKQLELRRSNSETHAQPLLLLLHKYFVIKASFVLFSQRK